MEILAGILIGYLLGTLSPAALFSKLKKINLRDQGTGNLGATNAALTLGKGYGALVMLLDIGKAFLACKLAQVLFPQTANIVLITGAAAMVGHMYPFYMKFKGGKGLAAFGGTVLAYDPWMFLLMLLVGVVLMLVINYSIALHIWAAVSFPILVALKTRNWVPTLISLGISILLMVKNWSVLRRIRRGEDQKIRDYLTGK